ncbi:histone H2B [Gregarina niphandrodes]|uniref:Histone H2B n=1 Tax=Gregarina niphandrodes TaxID=110365 RepID=A0A023BCF5_GRENI|nr:histone H2B [Gregarina niphandrodes]EZG82922.1 histone H2B [Gregarina niphandrodes]|eukprot:XP_011128975.1 histone H2B [Gregarina niphandrodes]
MAADKKIATKKVASKKVASKKVATGGERKRKHVTGKYVTYINKLLKNVHTDLTITSKAMSIVHSFVLDNFSRICDEASNLCKRTKTKTLGAREIQTAVRLILPGELSKHATNEGAKAVTHYGNAA